MGGFHNFNLFLQWANQIGSLQKNFFLDLYPFDSMHLQEWMYNNPWRTLGYYCNYCFGEWSTCLEGGLPPFSLSYPTTSAYHYHQRQFSNFDGCCHCWPDSHKYGSTSINNANTCSDDACSWKNTIIRWTSIRWWFHSPCYWYVWLFSFLIWFIFYCLCTYH